MKVTFSHTKAKATEFDFVVKWVKSTKYHNLMIFVILVYLLLHTNFKNLGLLILEKKIFKGFYYIWALGHVGHVTQTF